MARDDKGRFAKQQPNIFRWDIVAVVAIAVIVIATIGYVIPQWISDIQKQSHDAGYSEGYESGINLGVKNGKEIATNWTVCEWFMGGRYYGSSWEEYPDYYQLRTPYCERQNPRHVMVVDKSYNKDYDYIIPDWENTTFVLA